MRQLLLLSFLVLSIAVNAQTTLYVDSSVVASGSGTSWGTAYKTLNEALYNVNGTGTSVKFIVNIAQGTYFPTGLQSGISRDSTFLFKRNGVKLYGGFPSGGGIRNVTANSTILSGNIGSSTTSADNSYHVLVANNIAGTDSIMLDGLRITAGNANGTSTFTYNSQAVAAQNGGGMCNISVAGKVILYDCTFSDNNASGNGAGVYYSNVSAEVLSCAFNSNVSTAGSGGAIYNQLITGASTSTYSFIANSTFTGNTATAGGGICNSRTIANTGSHQIFNCTFSGNSAINSGSTSGGGGVSEITANTNPSSITQCTFTGNTAPIGGGLFFNNNYGNGVSNIIYCTFNTNTASIMGGGMYFVATNNLSNIHNCAFTGNKANVAGGGLYSVAAGSTAADVANCIFTGDSAAYGGGVYNRLRANINHCTFSLNKANNGAGLYYADANTGALSNDTFSGNLAAGNGGALYLNGSIYATFRNLLISGNKAINGAGIYDSAATPTIVNSTFSGNNATGNGTSLYNLSSPPSINSCILWDGTSNTVYNAGSSTAAITYSIVQGGYTGTGNLSSNPLFINPVASSLAPTTTGDYQLLPCSPAINAGTNSGIYTGLTDLANNPRLFGSTVDMGAFEYQGAVLAPITGNNAVCVNASIQLGNAIAGGTWSSGNSTIATVSSTGLVTGIAAGTVTITYTVISGSCTTTFTKSITVNALPILSAITGPSNVCPASTITLGNSTANGIWTSSNTAVATITAGGGVVTGVAPGTVTITYTVTNTSNCTNTATAQVTVNAPPVVAAITGSSALCINSTSTLGNATAGGIWSSTNTAIATVSTIGVVTPVAAGPDTIKYTVTNTNGCSTTVSMPVSVNALPVIAPITGNSTACANSSLQLSSTTTGGTWVSTNTAVATISSTGLVTPVSSGNADIRYIVTNTGGCADSVSKSIVINPVYNGTASVSICSGSQYVFGTQPLTASGTYTHIFSSSAGCDSIITLTLTVDTINNGVTQAGIQLTADQAGATYQWIDCGNGNTPVPGATSQSFIPPANGQYAVVVSFNNCSSVSACKTVSGVGIASINGTVPGLRVYPNPVSGIVTIASDKVTPTRILLRDVAGRVLKQITPTSAVTTIEVTSFVAGIYTIEVYSSSAKSVSAISIVR